MTAILKSALNKALPTGTAINMLKKIPGPISNFIQGAVASGYAADQIIDTVRDRFASTSEKEDVANLRKREAEGSLTPEERLRLREKKEPGVESFLKPAAALAGGIAASFLPPGVGGAGQIVDSLGSKGSELVTEEAVVESGNIIRDTDPSLADAVEKAIQQYGDPLKAGKLVKFIGKFNNPIGILEKRSGQQFADIVASIYGGGQQEAPQEEMQQQQQQQQQQGRSASDQGLMDILSQLEGILG